MTKTPTPQDVRKAQVEAEVKAKLAKEDLEKRLREFEKEFIPLLKKYKIGLSAEPRKSLLNLKGNDGISNSVWVDIAIPVWFDDTKQISEAEKVDQNKNKEEISVA